MLLSKVLRSRKTTGALNAGNIEVLEIVFIR
jgi:hypothetical protein